MTKMVLAGTGPPGKRAGTGPADGRRTSGEDTSDAVLAATTRRARLPPLSFLLRVASTPVDGNGASPSEGAIRAHAPLRTHAHHPARRAGRPRPGGHRPHHPPDHGGWWPDPQGRPMGPTPP